MGLVGFQENSQQTKKNLNRGLGSGYQCKGQHLDSIGLGATEERPGVWMGGTWGLQQRILGGAGIDMGAEGS